VEKLTKVRLGCHQISERSGEIKIEIEQLGAVERRQRNILRHFSTFATSTHERKARRPLLGPLELLLACV